MESTTVDGMGARAGECERKNCGTFETGLGLEADGCCGGDQSYVGGGTHGSNH